MTGDGTKENPLRPETWNEFVEAVETSAAYVECPERAVWDMNEINPDGLTSNIAWRAFSVEGNGTEIKNLYFNGGYIGFGAAVADDYPYMRKLNFTNFFTSASSERCFSMEHSGPFVIKRCNFSGVVSSGICFYAWMTNNAIYITHDGDKSCSINIEFTGSGAFTAQSSYQVRFEHARIIFSGQSTYKYDGYNYDKIVYRNCIIQGKSPFKTFRGRAESSIFDIVIPEEHTFDVSSPSSIVNVDKISGEIPTTDETLQVTTAQMGDAAYLQSIGFNILT